MTDLKSCLILILLTKFVETKISPDVRCAVNGDVYLRKSSQRSNLTSRSSEYIFASSETTVCDHQVAGDVLKIHGCVQVYFFSKLFYNFFWTFKRFKVSNMSCISRAGFNSSCSFILLNVVLVFILTVRLFCNECRAECRASFEHKVGALSVCPSVRPSVCPSVFLSGA
jgi:hypothetical protein